MDIGTQRDICDCLKSCDWRKLIYKVACLLTVSFLALMIMSAPTLAVVESVPPISGGTIWYHNAQPYPSADAACAATIFSESGIAAGCFATGAAPWAGDIAGGMVACTGICPLWGATPKILWAPIAFSISAVCPIPIVNPTIPYAYNGSTNICVRTVPDCPVHSSGTYPDACVCDTGYEVDAAKTSCVPIIDCKVKLNPFPPPNDACSQALENRNSTQTQKDVACGTLTPAMQTGQACLERKLAAMTPAAIPFVRTGDIRSLAYQEHFREIWDKMQEVVRLMRRDPAMRTACAASRAEIAAEKGCDNAGPCVATPATASTPAIPACYPASSTRRSHCLTAIPANPDPNGAAHTQGKAIDVSRTGTIDPLQAALGARNPPQTITQFLDAAPNCNLIWGGTFTTNYDPVHFLAR